MNIWTDGSCYPNPGPGGWAWFNEATGESDCGGEHGTTNNRMEMLAILKALSELPNRERVTIHSDSQYCIKGLTIWRNGWKRKDWMKNGQPMVNRDLWVKLDGHVSRLNIDFRWVKGHSGNRFNEMVDRLAAQGRSGLGGTGKKNDCVSGVELLVPNNKESEDPISLIEVLNALNGAKKAIRKQQCIIEKLELMIVNFTKQV